MKARISPKGKVSAGKWQVLNLFNGWAETEPSAPVKPKNYMA